jgi:hypothetical protein
MSPMSYDRGLAVMPGRQQAIEDQLEGFPVFPGLAIRQNHGRDGITAQALHQALKIKWSDSFVGDNGHLLAAYMGSQQLTAVEKLLAYKNRIAALAEINIQNLHIGPP